MHFKTCDLALLCRNSNMLSDKLVFFSMVTIIVLFYNGLLSTEDVQSP